MELLKMALLVALALFALVPLLAGAIAVTKFVWRQWFDMLEYIVGGGRQ